MPGGVKGSITCSVTGIRGEQPTNLEPRHTATGPAARAGSAPSRTPACCDASRGRRRGWSGSPDIPG